MPNSLRYTLATLGSLPLLVLTVLLIIEGAFGKDTLDGIALVFIPPLLFTWALAALLGAGAKRANEAGHHWLAVLLAMTPPAIMILILNDLFEDPLSVSTVMFYFLFSLPLLGGVATGYLLKNPRKSVAKAER